MKKQALWFFSIGCSPHTNLVCCIYSIQYEYKQLRFFKDQTFILISNLHVCVTSKFHWIANMSSGAIELEVMEYTANIQIYVL